MEELRLIRLNLPLGAIDVAIQSTEITAIATKHLAFGVRSSQARHATVEILSHRVDVHERKLVQHMNRDLVVLATTKVDGDDENVLEDVRKICK